MYATDSTTREQFIAGLRALADFLDAHRSIPVPPYGTHIYLHVSRYEDGGNAQVDRFARLLDAEIIDDTPAGGHYLAARAFGPVSYEVVSIPETSVALHDALMSYRDCVTPDGITR